MQKMIRWMALCMLCVLCLCLSTTLAEDELVVSLGENTITLGTDVRYSFTAPEAGTYAFYSNSTLASAASSYLYGYVYQVDRGRWDYYYACDNNVNRNFFVCYNMSEGERVEVCAYYSYNAPETEIPLVIQKMNVEELETYQVGDLPLHLEPYSMVRIPINPAETTYFSFKLDQRNTLIRTVNQNTMSINNSSNYGNLGTNGYRPNTYCLEVIAGAEGKDVVLTTESFKGQLGSTKLYADGQEIRYSSVFSAYQPLRFTFDEIPNAERYQVKLAYRDVTLNDDGSFYGSFTPGEYVYVEIVAEADGWVSYSSTFSFSIDSSVDEVPDGALELYASKTNPGYYEMVELSVESDSPVTMHRGNANYTGSDPYPMVRNGNTWTYREVGYTSSMRYWVTNTEGQYSNPVVVNWSYDNNPTYPVDDTFTTLKVNGVPYTEGMTIPEGMMEIETNFINNAQGIKVYVDTGSGHFYQNGYAYYNLNSSYASHYQPILRDIYLPAGTVRFYLTATDSMGSLDVFNSEIFTLNVEAPTERLPLSLSSDRVGQNGTYSLNNPNESELTVYAVKDNVMKKLITLGANRSYNVTADEVGEFVIYGVDLYGRTTEPQHLTVFTNGPLPKPSEFALGGKTFTKNTVIDLTPGQTYDLTVTPVLEEKTEYTLQMTQYTSDGAWGEYYTSDTGTFRIPLRATVTKLNIRVTARAAGWEESVSNYIDVTLGEVADSFKRVDMGSISILEGAVVSPYAAYNMTWNLIDDADRYYVHVTAPDGQTERRYGDSTGVSISLLPDYAYYDIYVEAVDNLGKTIVTSDTYRVTVGEAQLGAFSLTCDVERCPVETIHHLTSEIDARLIVFDSAVDSIMARPSGTLYAGYQSSQSAYSPCTRYYLAMDSKGNLSNLVTVEVYECGQLSKPEVLMNGKRLVDHSQNVVRARPGEQCTVSMSVPEDAEITWNVSISFYNEYGSYIPSAVYYNGPESTYTFTLDSRAASMSINVSAQAYGWKMGSFWSQIEIGAPNESFANLALDGKVLDDMDHPLTAFVPHELTWDAVEGASYYKVETDRYTQSYAYEPYEYLTIPLDSGMIRYTITAYDNLGNELGKSDPISFVLVKPEAAFTMALDTDEVWLGDAVTFTSSKSGTLYMRDMSALDSIWNMKQIRRVSTDTPFAYVPEKTGRFQFWLVDIDNNVSAMNEVTVKVAGSLTCPQLFINGADADDVILAVGDTLSFTVPEVAHADEYSLYVYYRGEDTQPISYDKFKGSSIKGVTGVVPEGTVRVDIDLTVSGKHYLPNEVHRTLKMENMASITGIKFNDEPVETAAVYKGMSYQITFDEVPGSRYYRLWIDGQAWNSVMTSNLFRSVSLYPDADSVRITIEACDDMQVVFAKTSFTLNMQEMTPKYHLEAPERASSFDGVTLTVTNMPSNYLYLFQRRPDGTFSTVYGQGYAEHVYTGIDQVGEYTFWMNDQTGCTNPVKVYVYMSEEADEPDEPEVPDEDDFTEVTFNGESISAFEAGTDYSIGFNEIRDAISYRVIVLATNAEGIEYWVFGTEGEYIDMNGSSVHIPVDAVSVFVGISSRKADDTEVVWVDNAAVTGGIEPLKLPESTINVQAEAFANINASAVVINSGCTTIGSRAFANNPQLVQIYVPDSVTSMADDMLAGCSNVHIFGKWHSYAQEYAAKLGLPFN